MLNDGSKKTHSVGRIRELLNTVPSCLFLLLYFPLMCTCCQPHTNIFQTPSMGCVSLKLNKSVWGKIFWYICLHMRAFMWVYVWAHCCRELTAASWLLLLSMRGDGRYLTELPVQTLNSWKQTVTTGALCLRVEGKTEEREGLGIFWCCTS